MRMMRAGLALAALSLAVIPVGCEQGGDATEITALRNENRALKASLDALSEKVDGLAGKAAPVAESAGARPIDAAKMKSEIRSEIFEEMNLKLAALQNVAAPTATTVDAAAAGGPIQPELKAYLATLLPDVVKGEIEAREIAKVEAAKVEARAREKTDVLADIENRLTRIAENTPMSAVDREKIKTLVTEFADKRSVLIDQFRGENGRFDFMAFRNSPNREEVEKQIAELRSVTSESLKASVSPELYTAVSDQRILETVGFGGGGMARGGGGFNGGGGQAPAPGREAQPRNNNQPRRGGGDANPAQPSEEGGGEQPAPRRPRRDGGNGGNNNQ